MVRGADRHLVVRVVIRSEPVLLDQVTVGEAPVTQQELLVLCYVPYGSYHDVGFVVYCVLERHCHHIRGPFLQMLLAITLGYI